MYQGLLCSRKQYDESQSLIAPPLPGLTCAILSIRSCFVASGSFGTSSSMKRGSRSRESSPKRARLICNEVYVH
jgi:hypothetical protein